MSDGHYFLVWFWKVNLILDWTRAGFLAENTMETSWRVSSQEEWNVQFGSEKDNDSVTHWDSMFLYWFKHRFRMCCYIQCIIFDFHVTKISKVKYVHLLITHPSGTRKTYHSSVNKMINDSSYHFSIMQVLIYRTSITY